MTPAIRVEKVVIDDEVRWGQKKQFKLKVVIVIDDGVMKVAIRVESCEGQTDHIVAIRVEGTDDRPYSSNSS
jgi:VCBS repeat-containing protein